MKRINAWAARLFVGLLFAILVQGIRLYLSYEGIHPEIWVAETLGYATNTRLADGIGWMIVGAGGLAGVFIAKILQVESITNVLSKKAIAIVYANECNQNHIQSLFKISSSMLPDGKPITHRLVRHRFFIGVENKSEKTLRNARLVIRSISLPPTVLNFPCKAQRTNSESVDIQPRDTELFEFGTGFDTDFEAGMFRAEILPAERIEQIASSPAVKHFGFVLESAKGKGLPLLKNDGYLIEVTAYADDVLPATATVRLNAKTRTEVLLEAP